MPSEPTGQTAELQTQPGLFNIGGFCCHCDTWELFPSEPLHARRGVCALRGLLGNRHRHVITADFSTTPQTQTGPSLSPLTCCTGSFLWSWFCRTPAVLPAASFPHRPPGGTWGFAPGSRDDLCFGRQCHRNGVQPKSLKIKSGVTAHMLGLDLKMAAHQGIIRTPSGGLAWGHSHCATQQAGAWSDWAHGAHLSHCS